MSEISVFYGKGKRKNAIARVYLREGQGNVSVNGRPIEEFFGRPTLRMVVNQPFEVTNTEGKFDVYVNTCGGGLSGQAGAIRHGISRALIELDETNRQPLRKAGFVTRDARVKERKKYGQRGARARFQFSKR